MRGGDEMADIPTEHLSSYITEMGIKISAISRETKISNGILQRSLSTRERSLRAGEFLKICDFLGKDPFDFFPRPNQKNSSLIV